jgi:radical SAM protein with 4Fe4S-binding SPASM domain
MQQLLEALGWTPRTGVWEITRACNLHCGHCGSSAGTARAGELSTEEARRLIEQLGELGTRHLTLSGGEPTLREDWPELVRVAVGRGITVNLVTNGQTDAHRLGTLARQTGLVNVAVSLDGLEPTHDALRGPGTFRRAVAAIRTLVGADVWVDVMVTVNRRNLSELAELYAHLAELGVRRFRAQLGKPIGNQTHRRDLTLLPSELLELLALLGSLRSGPRVLVGDSLGYFSREERRLRGEHCDQGHWTGCYAGCQAIGIQSDGGIKGCLSLQPRAGERDPFVEGNVRAEPLSAIWLRPGAFAYNRSPTHELEGACARCGHRTVCRGGAKCVAYAFTGDVKHDPMCYLAVARQRQRSARHVWPASGAAAAAMLLFGMLGCDGETTPGGETGGGGQTGVAGGGSPGGGGAAQGGKSTGGASAADAGSDGVNCQTVCCMCDYGIIPPELYQACCGN